MEVLSIDQDTQIRFTEAGNIQDSFAADVRRGLTHDPKILFPKYLYDQRGSELFEEICRLPEYYQTRTERRILAGMCGDFIRRYRPTTLVEFGAGAATKTRLLLDSMQQADRLNYFVPIDVSAAYLRQVATDLAGAYPETVIHGVVGDFLEPFRLPYADEPRLIIFLGSTIGNLTDREAGLFLRYVAEQMHAGDLFLLGTDLVKDPDVLEAAYNDTRGVTAAFNRNILRIINRKLDGDFQPSDFHHQAFYNRGESRIEMHLVSERDHTVHLREPDLTVAFREGESVRTEISRKYTRPRVEQMLRSAGLELLEWHTDPREYFALSVSRLQEGAPDDSRHNGATKRSR